MHIDMDSFFCSVETRYNPNLKGKPVIVGANPLNGKGRGVVSAASYEARKYKIHSGMPISKAYKLCPKGIFLPVNFKIYTKASENIMNILQKYATNIQQISIDEAFLDISKTETYKNARMLAIIIKSEILRKEKITCSIGIAQNKLLAKIASDIKKPNGLTIVKPKDTTTFLAKLPVKKIPGIGKKTEISLANINIKTINELKKCDIQKLQNLFGKLGKYMHDAAHGIDNSPVKKRNSKKSIGREHTFKEDTSNPKIIKNEIEKLASNVHKDISNQNFIFKTISIKIRYMDFETHTKEKTLKYHTNDINTIIKNTKELLETFKNKKKIRLLGIRVTNIKKTNKNQKTISDYKI